MFQDLHNETVRRLQELGLPPSLMDLGDFRDHFFNDRWVMFVRDGDPIANVHLVQPRPGMRPVQRDSRRSGNR